MSEPVIFTGDMEVKLLSAWADHTDKRMGEIYPWLQVQDLLISINLVGLLGLSLVTCYLGYRVYTMEKDSGRPYTRGPYRQSRDGLKVQHVRSGPYR
jgi:hypothetical protein